MSTIQLSDEVIQRIQTIASQENRSPESVILTLLAQYQNDNREDDDYYSDVQNDNDLQLWESFVAAYNEYETYKNTLFNKTKNIVDIVRYALENRNIVEALEIIKHFDESELKLIVDKVLYFSSYFNGFTKTFEGILFSISPKWLTANIEKYAEAILELEEPYEEYGRLFYIYEKLDRELVVRLAKRASQHADEEIRSMGQRKLKEATYLSVKRPV